MTMQKDLLHEVATPLHVDSESVRNYPDNDDTYRRYTRCLRHYHRMAWQNHICWYCTKRITDFYEAWVYVAQPGIFVHKLGRVATFWVEKRHYPECPDRLREFEEEMDAAWKEHNQAAQTVERRAA